MEGAKTTCRKSTLNVASILCWLLGILNLAGSMSIGGLPPNSPIIISFIMFVIGITLCTAGYGLKKKQKYAGVLAIFFTICALSYPVLIGLFSGASFVYPPNMWLILGILIIVFTAIDWKELK